MRVGYEQYLLNSMANMPIMKCGRLSKTDTVMRYLEHGDYRAILGVYRQFNPTLTQKIVKTKQCPKLVSTYTSPKQP